MVIYSPAGGFVYMTPDGAMANLQSLQRREAVKLWKQGIKNAFGNRCAYCGVKTETLTLDHIKPRCDGGEDLATNLVPACRCCNQDKGSQQWQHGTEITKTTQQLENGKLRSGCPSCPPP